MPHGTFYCRVVIINDVSYVGGGGAVNDVLEYHPVRGEWSELPRPPVWDFAMASLNAQLLLVGGEDDDGKILRVWKGARGGWAQPYPYLPTLPISRDYSDFGLPIPSSRF